jgi:N-succinyldiaminopimelate aminotransferase
MRARVPKGVTVFSEFSALAEKHGAINLGQGFPDFDGPADIREAAAKALRKGANQYAASAGLAELRSAIAQHAERFYDWKVDPHSMVVVTSGATEAIFDAISASVGPGDEVILFEPYYDSYAASVELAGATAKYVRLRPPDAQNHRFWFDESELASCFTARTRMLVLNNPHNPTGKVFTKEELGCIAELCIRHRVRVLSDEVYEHLVFSPARHIPVATLPGMAERTFTVSSGGKVFGLTGWKIGWAIAPPPLRDELQGVHQFVTFATATPLQLAIAFGLTLPDRYFSQFVESYRDKRDRLMQGLSAAGFIPFQPDGSYFILADATAWRFADDFELCRHLVSKVGVAAIPPSAFYSEAHRGEARQWARFAFCKKNETLDEASARLFRGRPLR